MRKFRFAYSKNEIYAVLYRVIQGAGWFVSGRIILVHVGQEEYGFVSVILSLAAWLQMFDFGITSFLRSELPKARLDGGPELVLRYFKSAMRTTAVIASLLLVLCNALLFFLPSLSAGMIGLLRADTLLEPRDLNLVIAGLSLYSLMLISGNMLQAYLAAFGRQYIFFMLTILGCVLQPAAVWWTAAEGHSIPALFAAFSLTPVLPGFLLMLLIVGKRLSADSRPAEFRIINKTSLSYLIIQFGGAVLGNLDLILVSHFFGLRDAAVYSMFKLIVQFPVSLHAQFNMQSWPEYSMLSGAKSQYFRLSALFMRNSRIAAAIALGLVLGLTAAGPWVIALWSNGTLHASFFTAFLFSFYGGIFIVANTFNVLMFSFNYTKGILATVCCALPGFFLLVSALQWIGSDAVVLSNIVITAVGLCVGLLFYVREVRPYATRPESRQALP